MSARKLLMVFVVAVPSLVGCQSTPDPSIELLESELRWYEDQLYLMDRKLGHCCQQLESAKRYNAALQEELVRQSGGEIPDVAEPQSDTKHSPNTTNSPLDFFKKLKTKPKTSSPNTDADALNIPSVIHGSPGSSDDAPTTELPPDNETPSTNGVPEVELFDEEMSGFEPDDISAGLLRRDNFVSQVVFNPQLTGGHNSDGRPGDDGLFVVLEPQNAGGDYVPIPGEITIEVFDATRPENVRSRVARWDFDAVETSSAMRKSLLGKGIHLELAWPAGTPESETLIVNAKYIRPDGSRLSASREIRIDSTGRRSIRR